MADIVISQVARSTPFDATVNGLTSTNCQDAIDEVDIEVQVTNVLRVMKSPGHADYSSVATALASITSASATNPYLIKIGPGVFTEPQLQMKSYVYIEGSGEQATVLQPSNVNQNFILAVENSQIKKCLITGTTGSGYTAIYMSSATASDTTGFFIEDCRFGNNDTHIIVSAVNNNNALFVTQCKIGGSYQFNNGFKATTTGTGQGRIVILDLTTTTMTAPFPNYVAYATGSGCQIWANACFFNVSNSSVSTGSCFQIDSGATLRISGVTCKSFGKAFWVQNIGSASTIYADAIICENNTQDIEIDHPTSMGNMIGIATLSKITNSATTTVGMFILDSATGASSVRGFRTGLANNVTAASTLVLVGGSYMVQNFTGTTSGQVIQMPNATTLSEGHRFEFWNDSTQNIAVKDNGSNTLTTLLPEQMLLMVLDDNTTTNGVWLLSATAITGSGGKAVTGAITFAQPGLGAGSYLRIGGNSSNAVGYLVPGTTNLVNITISIQNTVSNDTVIQLQNRSAVGTLADIAGASVTIPNGQYKASVNLAISIGPGYEICAYVKSGSLPGFSVCEVYFSP